MRDLSTAKAVSISKENIVRIELDRLTNTTTVLTAKGYLEQGKFIPVEIGSRYEIKGTSDLQSDAFYWQDIDRQNAPFLDLYGLRYRAKQDGVFILYSKLAEAGPPELIMTDSTIEIKVDLLVTTNQEIIDLVNVSAGVSELIYAPEVFDINADVDAPNVPKEIKHAN